MDTTMAVLFTLYMVPVNLLDNLLRPLVAKGLTTPMPVILIGALGGMVTKGVIGLFMGPVILAVGYELFWQWVKEGHPVAELESKPI